MPCIGEDDGALWLRLTQAGKGKVQERGERTRAEDSPVRGAAHGAGAAAVQASTGLGKNPNPPQAVGSAG